MYNVVVLAGRLTADPELQYTPQSKAVAKFRLAVDRPGSGENKTADFFPIVAWEKLAETVTQYLGKGSPVIVQGRLQTRFWDQNGERKYITEVIADQIRFLPGKKKADGESQQTGASEPSDDDSVPF